MVTKMIRVWSGYSGTRARSRITSSSEPAPARQITASCKSRQPRAPPGNAIVPERCTRATEKLLEADRPHVDEFAVLDRELELAPLSAVVDVRSVGVDPTKSYQVLC